MLMAAGIGERVSLSAAAVEAGSSTVAAASNAAVSATVHHHSKRRPLGRRVLQALGLLPQRLVSNQTESSDSHGYIHTHPGVIAAIIAVAAVPLILIAGCVL